MLNLFKAVWQKSNFPVLTQFLAPMGSLVAAGFFMLRGEIGALYFRYLAYTEDKLEIAAVTYQAVWFFS